MTIKKTGPGPNLPSPPSRTDGPKGAAASKAPASEPVFEAGPVTVPAPHDADSFDDEPALVSAERNLDDLLKKAGARPSQVRSMEALLARTAEKLTVELGVHLAELETFKRDALAHVDPESLPEIGAQLFKRRREAARLRRRLLGIHRRMKLSGSLAAGMGAVSDLGRLQRAVDGIAQRRGADQADAILQTLPKLSPSGHISRIDVPGDADRVDLASLLAHGVPGAAMVRALQVLAGQTPPAVDLSDTEQALLDVPPATHAHRGVKAAAQLSQAFVES